MGTSWIECQSGGSDLMRCPVPPLASPSPGISEACPHGPIHHNPGPGGLPFAARSALRRHPGGLQALGPPFVGRRAQCAFDRHRAGLARAGHRDSGLPRSPASHAGRMESNAGVAGYRYPGQGARLRQPARGPRAGGVPGGLCADGGAHREPVARAAPSHRCVRGRRSTVAAKPGAQSVQPRSAAPCAPGCGSSRTPRSDGPHLKTAIGPSPTRGRCGACPGCG